jgi:hypothetical protein
LSAPAITAAQEGQTKIQVTAASGDNSVPGLQLSVQIYPSGDPTASPKPLPRACLADSGTHACFIQLDQPLLAGDAIEAQASATGYQSPGPTASSTVTAVESALSAPRMSQVQEGSTNLQVFLNKEDRSKQNLDIYAEIFSGNAPAQSGTCTVTSGSDNCSITLKSALIAGQIIHAQEVQTSGSQTGGASGSAASSPPINGPVAVARVQELGYDWGRARAYFSLGAVFSRSYIPASSSSSSTGTNFSSPDLFAGLDMDFNWYTSQKCESYRFGERPVKIATLMSAIAQCSLRNSAQQRRIKQQNQNDNASILDSAAYANDQSVRSLLTFIAELNLNGPNLRRLRQIARFLKPPPCNQPECVRPLRQWFAELVALQLSPDEAEAILNQPQFNFDIHRAGGWLINSYFDARLTQTNASNGTILTSSPNSAHIEAGLYAPFYFNWSQWPYARSNTQHALFMAPIAKIGFDSLRASGTDPLLTTAPAITNASACTAMAVGTPTCSAENLQNAITALNKDVYRMMAFGGRLGFFGLSPNPSREPETISYIDVTYGRFDNFFVQKYDDKLGGIRYPWRLDITGRLKIPATPMFIGMDINKGVGPDAMSIFVGARTDLSSLLTKLIPTTSAAQ